jgi:pyridoxamine 5'-phosphate oxidase
MRDGKIASMRQDYTIGELLESNAPSEPWELFSSWFEIARNTKILEPNAMILSTVRQDGQPTSRVVLLKDFDQSGLVFFY